MNRTALVTGGAVRVGRALCLALAHDGWDVIVHYHSSAGEAEDVAAAVREAGRTASTVRADLADPASAPRMRDHVAATHGRLDLLVNSAATFERTPIDRISVDEWDHVMAVNLRAPFLLSQQLAPLLRQSGDGLIVNIADLSAFQAWPSYAHHAVSKAGLVHLTRVLARALAPAIRVNAIAPGTVLPPEDPRHDAHTDERRLTERSGRPDDVAHALLYLTGAGFVTGDVLTVDGGRIWNTAV
jgi:NAD(P)-dependent dehydrogenase (short-subunit alcohol dehydrogenase family)